MKKLYAQLGILFLIVIGLFLMLVSLSEHYSKNETSFCDISSTINCSLVNKGPYSEFFGFPVAGYGLLFFLALLFLFLAYLLRYKKFYLNVLYYLSFLGLLVALTLLVFVYIKLNALCPVCLTTDFVIVALFFLFYFLRKTS